MDLFLEPVLGKPLWMWTGFLAAVFLLTAFDLGVLQRGSREIGVRASLGLSAFYIACALVFGAWIWSSLGREAAIIYLTGFVVEKSLSLDNIFVIALIFGYFGIPRAFQHRVLIYGILGVILLRGLFIGAGATIVSHFSWVLYVFAAFLVLTGIKMLLLPDREYDVASNPVLRIIRRRFRVSDTLHGDRFFIRRVDPRTGRRALFLTPLFLALVMIEIADVIFAIDSIPAIFAITTDAYLVFTSNVFAILGLRALYFALSAMIDRFALLKYALALVLVFIGGKILVAEMFDIGKVPVSWSLGITLTILACGVAASLWSSRGHKNPVQHRADGLYAQEQEAWRPGQRDRAERVD